MASPKTIAVKLETWEITALRRLARQERRTLEAQAEWLVVNELRRAGMFRHVCSAAERAPREKGGGK